jgi:GPH family glycoside/pentoside/hexuronide:cation symporter
MAIQEDLSEWELARTRKMVSYGFGYVFINYILQVALAGVFFFYENLVGLDVVLLGLAMVIFAIWNMINDPLLGYLTDRPMKWTKKYGLRAPWVILTTFPIVIIYFFIWTPPNAGPLIIFLWFIIITCIFDTFFSIYNDHVYGGFTNQFPSEYERRRAFAIATLLLGIFFTLMGIMASATIVVMDQSSYVRWAFILCIILAIYGIFQMFGLRESEKMKEMFFRGFEKAERKGFLETMKTSIKERNFTVSLVGYTVQITCMILFGASGLYYWAYILKIPYFYNIIPTFVGMAAFIGWIPFWYNYSRKHGFKKTYWFTFILHGITFIPFIFMAQIISLCMGSEGIFTTLGRTYTTVLIWSIIVFIMYSIYSGEVIMLMPVASDTYDQVASVMRKRVDATLVGVRNFFFRIAYLVVGIIIPLIHILTLYDPGATTQNPLAVWGIAIHGAAIPAVLFITMGLIFRKYYTLEGAEKQALVKKLKDLGLYR